MPTFHLGCCISAHGFGHAARTLAVMEALSDLVPLHCTIVSLVPEWFFRASYSGSLSYYPEQTDVGMVQCSPLEEDVPRTVRELARFYPLRREYTERLAHIFADCDLVLCDIAPAGIVAAREAGVCSVLLENFTWDWVYEGYLPRYGELRPFIQLLRDLFSQPDYHIRAVPYCNSSPCSLVADPIARKIRCGREQVRKLLGVESERKLVLYTMGGESMRSTFRHLPAADDDIVYLVPGQGRSASRHLRILEPDSGLHHPDLVAACDAVVGKAGYSTLAEVYHAAVPFGYVRRPQFRESGPLEAFITSNMAAMDLSAVVMTGREPRPIPPELFLAKYPRHRLKNGADQCGAFLAALLHKSKQSPARL